MSRTTVHLLRHGEVENPDKILYGRLPGYVLSERGHAMAAMVAQAFVAGRDDVTHLVSSPLERARQTAQPLADALGLDVVIDPRIIEAENALEGRPVAGGGWRNLLTPDSLRHLYNPLRPSWGEPFTQQRDRMFAAIATARRAAQGHEAVLVSHQSPIWAVRRALQGRPLWHDPRTRECSLASVTSLTFEGATLVAHSYSEPAAALLPGASAVAGA
ncbi:histidine phosphatase family protein [Litorihabitans aurantiacus]|uniref:Histidine phosphatase family protein n=1 Tax=Litorihabitans aurantiacus TaxID=1930061 RepID=A0AA38CU53_9MICO|nr:histidine phosphatase family protein [Litorihabitans aurantiacus]GMA32409.1 histidine phosphatase family protein [Litorihabitans aurantiacus]